MRSLLLVLLTGFPAVAQMLPRLAMVPAPPAADPFPIERIALPADQLPPASAGPLVARPLAEFDAKLRAADAAPPRILTATYSASLRGSDLVGDGEMQIAATAPSMLALEPLSIALAEPRWKTAAATLDRSGGTTRLWIAAASGPEFLFRWSARGREEPGILRYELRFPAVAIASLELDLPGGRTVSAGDVLVAGPLPSAKPNMQQWRLALGGRSKLELVIAEPSVATGLASFSRSAKYDLSAGSGTFDFEIEALRGPVAAWTFRVDPDVRVLDVVTPNRDAWQFDADRREVTVSLREPSSHGRASILAALAIPQSGPAWPCAAVHGLGVTGDDAIELRVGADPQLADWDPGDYTLARTAPLADRGYVLVMNGSWRRSPSGRKPPSITVRPAQPTTTANIALDWQPSPTRNRLAARIRFDVQHGPVSQIVLKLPPGYTSGAVRFSPDDSAANTRVTGTTLTLEPSRPWTTGQAIEARFDLRGPPIEMAKPIAIPKVMPATAMHFEGELTVTLEPGLSFAGREDRSLRQTFTRRDDEPFLRFIPTPLAAPPSAPGVATPAMWDVVSQATAAIDEVGMVRVQLTGTVLRAGGARLPVSLPADGELQWAIVNGKYLDIPHNGPLLQLPVTDSDVFEVNYRRLSLVSTVISDRPEVAPRVLEQPVAVKWTRHGADRIELPDGTLVRRSAIAIVAPLLLGLAYFTVRGVMRLRQSARTSAIAILLFATMLFAQPLETPTVYIRDSDAMAFAPRSFFDRLDKLSDADRPSLAFTGAAIAGSSDETHARFEITLSAVSEREPEQTVTLPVQGIALESVTLDGTPAYPVTTGSRFALPIRGKGAHTVVVRGRVPLAVKGADREATLPIDPLPMAKLTMTLSPLARSVRVPNRDGSFRSERKLTGTAIDADIGSASPVVVRWRSGGLIEQPARITAASATLWDLSAGEAAVTAAYSVRVEEGSLARLAFEIPPNLEPGRLSIRAADGTVIGIRDGRLTANANGTRTYSVQLQEPLEGSNTLVLRLASIVPLNATPQLRVVKLATARETASFLLARAASPVERWERSGAIETSLDAVARELGSVPELGLERAPQAVAFRGEGWLRPVFRLPTLPLPVAEDITWQFGTRATVETSVRFEKNSILAAVEFDVPAAVVVSEVLTPDLAGWSRTGNRIRVWFRTPQKEITVKWFGTWPMPKLPVSFELPLPLRAVPYRIVRLRTADSLKLETAGGWQSAITLTPRETALLAPTANAPLRLKLENR